MKRIKESQKEQGILFSNHYVGDRLSEDDEVFLFERLFDKLDISAITNSYSNEGGSMYSPRDQLAVIIYAFHKGITSSVKMAELVRNSLPFIYLSGGHVISRRTISDFRLRHGDTITEILESSANLAIEAGLISNDDLYAIDGSKIEANASFSNTRKKNEWEERQKRIIDYVDNFLKKWEEQDKLEEDFEKRKKERFDRINEKLKKIKKVKQQKGEKDKDVDRNVDSDKIKQSSSEDGCEKEIYDKDESKAVYLKNRIKITELEDAERYLTECEEIDTLLDEYGYAEDEMYLSLTDPDCRMMKSDSIVKECYNVQVITNNQVIVAADVTQDENDQHQLEPMIEKLKRNLKFSEEDKIKLGADAGYNMGKNLEYLALQKWIDPYISMFDRSEGSPNNNKFHKENFEYDEDEDRWICTEEKYLEFMKEYIRDNKKYTMYGCELKDCIFCKNKDKCVLTKADEKRGSRTIEDDGCLIYRQEMRTKMKQEESKKIYSKRSGSVEPVFGQIKNNRGFTRFRLRGLLKVKIEFSIMAIAHNLGKIMKYMQLNECNI